MTDIVIHGFPQSTFVRTTRMVCEEKGVTHEVAPLEFGSEAHLALHPFGRIPAIQHGDVRLYEAGAIARYVDRTFDGPPLQPADTRALALMDQWVSAVTDYFDKDITRALVIQRLVVPARGGEPDEQMIADAVPKTEHHLGELEKALGESDFIAGGALSLADLFAAPVVFYVSLTPEGQGIMPKFPAVGSWLERMQSRPSFAATQPPMPGQQAA